MGQGGALDTVNEKHITEGLYQLVAMPGMRVLQVNDITGDDAALAEALRKVPDGTVRLKIRRGEVTSSAKESMQKAVSKMALFNPKGSLGKFGPLLNSNVSQATTWSNAGAEGVESNVSIT